MLAPILRSGVACPPGVAPVPLTGYYVVGLPNNLSSACDVTESASVCSYFSSKQVQKQVAFLFSLRNLFFVFYSGAVM